MTSLLEKPVQPRTPDSTSESKTGKTGYISVALDRVIPGSVLHNPIYDRKGVLLVKSGLHLTSAFLEKLHARGISYILAHQNDVPYLKGEIATDGKPNQVPPTLAAQSLGIDPARLQKVASSVAETVDRTRQLQHALAGSQVVHLEQPRELIDETYARIQDDADVALFATLFPKKPSYPAGQGSSSAAVAMSMAQVLGFNERAIRELGIGCLLHDTGMLKLDRELVLSTEVFDLKKKLQVCRHVEASSNMIARIRNVPHECRLVATQIHERADGAGYPCRITGTKFHPLARIAAVADCYVAMISPRLYRPAHTPYRAIENMLKQTRTGRFDKQCMRALLQVVSLFPIGSIVELSDGRTARVIRSNPQDYTRPVVEILLHAKATTGVEVVNLVQSYSTNITRVIEA